MSGSLPKETLAQVLIYLAENEKFFFTERPSLTPERVKEALKELGEEILYGLEASNEEVEEILEDLSPKAKQVLSELSEDDRQKLFSKFVQ